MYLADIEEHHILLLRKSLQDKGLAHSTINKYVQLICDAMAKAVRRGLPLWRY
jgi:hypothetical protein